jgi:hypothetical protein
MFIYKSVLKHFSYTIITEILILLRLIQTDKLFDFYL